MKTTHILFIRHGEVENPSKILYGRLPGFGLSEVGRKQLIQVAEQLKKRNVDVIFSSPLLRAWESAGILSNRWGLTPKVSRLLIEVDLVMEGMSTTEYKTKVQPHLYDPYYLEQGQESIDHIKYRMTKFLHRILTAYKGKTIAIVSHGDPIGILKAAILNKPFTFDFKMANYLKTGQWAELICKDYVCKWLN